MRDGAEPRTRLERVELGLPVGLWEGHLADGRLEAVGRLLEWMEPVEGLGVLDVGCGHGTLALELARRGARVLACDRRVESAVSTRRRARHAGEAVSVVAADAALLATATGLPRNWLCWEVFEHLGDEERRRLLLAMEATGAETLHFAVRVESRLDTIVGPLLGGPTERPVTIDSVALLRQIHLETDLRLVERETLTRRNSALTIAQMRRPRADL